MTPQEQDFLDRCAIEAMGALVAHYGVLGRDEYTGLAESVESVAAHDAYELAFNMLTERRKRIDSLKVQAEHDNPNEAI